MLLRIMMYISNIHYDHYLQYLGKIGCRTTAGIPCILPFRYQKHLYSTCTATGNTVAWCPTESTTVPGWKWGVCDSLCPLEEGTDCYAMLILIVRCSRNIWNSGYHSYSHSSKL